MAQFIHLNRLYEVDADYQEMDPCYLSKQKLAPIIEEMHGKEALSAFENKFDLFFPNNYKDLFGLFLHHLTTIFEWVDLAEPGTAKRQERDETAFGFIAITLSMLTSVESDDDEDEDDNIVNRLSKEFCEKCCEDTNCPQVRIRAIMVLFNMFRPDYELRYDAFEYIVQCAENTKQFELLVPYLEYLPDWIVDWELDVERRRSLYMRLYKNMGKLGNKDKAHEYLKCHVELFKGEPTEVLSAPEVVQAAMDLVVDAVKVPLILQVDDILSLDAVKQLRTHADTSGQIFTLLEIFRSGSLDDLKKFTASHGATMKQYEIDPDVCMAKLRLLTIASLCQGQSEIPLSTVATALQVSDAEVETWVVRALSQGVVDGRIDQIRKVVQVKSALQRQFGKPQWEFLNSRLDCWIQNIKGLQESFKNAQAGRVPN